MEQYGSWIVTIIGVIGFLLAGKKVWWSWYINIANQVLWGAFAIVTEQWGFLIGIPLYLSVFMKNAYDWTKEHREEERCTCRNSRGLPPRHAGYRPGVPCSIHPRVSVSPPKPPSGNGGGSI